MLLPVKAEGHLGRCYLKRRNGDANAILSAVGYNLRLVLAWLRTILRIIFLALVQTFATPISPQLSFLTIEDLSSSQLARPGA